MNFVLKNNNDYEETIKNIINEKKKEIFDFFESKEVALDFNIYVYNSKEKLIKGIEQRGFKNQPDYMCACFKDEDKSLNFFVPKEKPSKNEFSKEEYKQIIYHELIHGITYLLFKNQPEWLCEGIAKYLDNEYSKGIDSLLKNYIHKQLIPNQYEIENEFGMHNYDSYIYAYIMVSYLIETLGKKEFITLLKDNKKLEEASCNLLVRSICYYNNKYFKDEYYNADLNNPQWLFHGSVKKLEQVNTILSHDSSGNKENIDNAVFTSSSKLIASAYAFKDTIKENSKDLDWDFNIENSEKQPIMIMKNVLIDEFITGYIYVFINNGKFKNEPKGSLQYKSFNNLHPIDVIKIKYTDYKDNYKVINN